MWAEYAHNTLRSSATGMSPFECQFGYAPPLFPEQEVEMAVPSAQQFIKRCRQTWRKARLKLPRTSQQYQQQANRRRRPAPTLRPGTDLERKAVRDGGGCDVTRGGYDVTGGEGTKTVISGALVQLLYFTDHTPEKTIREKILDSYPRDSKMSEKKRSSQRGTAGTAGACTQDSTSDQRLKCFRDIMDVVLHLSDEEWKAVTRDMKKKVTKLEFAALCTKIVTSAASSAIRRLLTPLIESFGIDLILQAKDKLKKREESKWRKWSDSDASAQRSPTETSDFICQLVQRIATQTKAAMLEAIRKVASGRRAICSASASSPAEDQISQPDDLSMACTNEICEKILALYYSDDFDRPGGEKTSGTSLKCHQEVHGIMKGLEEVVSISRSSFELTLKSSSPDSVPVTIKVMAPDCASSANAERLFSDQFLSKATQEVRKVLLKTEEKIAASMSSQTSVPVRSETETNSLMEEVESTSSEILWKLLFILIQSLCKSSSGVSCNDADQSAPEDEQKNFLSGAEKIHENIFKQVFTFVSGRKRAISEKNKLMLDVCPKTAAELNVRSENVQEPAAAAERFLDKAILVASEILEKWLSSHISTGLFSGKDSGSSTESSPTASVDLDRVTADIVNTVISGIALENGITDVENGSEARVGGAQVNDADARSAPYSKNFSDVFTKLRSLIGLGDKKRQSCSCLKNAAAAEVTAAQSLVSVSEAPNLQAVIDSCTEELIEKNADIFLHDELLAKSSSSKAPRLRRFAFLRPRKSGQQIVSEVKKTCEVSSSVPLRSKELLNKATQVVSVMLLRRLSTADSSMCSLEDEQSAVSTADSLVRVLYECDESVKEETKSSDALDALSCFFDVREAESDKKPRNVLRKVRSLLQAFFSKASEALSSPTHEERVEEKVDLDLCTNRVIAEVIDLLRSELTAPPTVKNDDAYFHSKSTRRVSDIIFRMVESCPLLPSQFPKERHTESRLRKVASALNLQVVSTASEISRTVSSTVQQFIDADRKSRPSVQSSSFAPLHLFTVVRNKLKAFFTSFSKRVADDERTDASAQSERDEDRVTPIYISEDGTVHELSELEDLSPEEMIHRRARAITDVIAKLLLRNVDRAGDVGQRSSDSVLGRGNITLRSIRLPSQCVYTFAEESIKALLQNVLNAGPSAGNEAQESSLADESTCCPSATALARKIEDAGTSSVCRINDLHPKSPQLSAASSSSCPRADVEETREHLSITDQQNRSGSDGCSSHPAAEDQEKKKRLGLLTRNGRMIRSGVKSPKKWKKNQSRVPLTGDDQPTPSTSANLHSSSHRESKASGSVFKNARRRLGRIFSNISKTFTSCSNPETAP
ncbi:uncharacterized protein LOC113528171 [Pangasianodon hypophthalmus]|uniref:uncharacterized protein LOC113528171 n=1 Tax=Pangasianodon hypophthalmus TaxID=310915 RepID=UPI00230745B8|nr:uncharacterized protein LOC113528171 [Pangasianodon hypophthalmus]